MLRLHVLINGHVQGVGFRAWTMRKARQLGLTGWVRNQADGGVEAAFYGEEGALNQILAACRKGPVGSHVRDVEYAFDSPTGPVPDGFEIRF